MEFLLSALPLYSASLGSLISSTRLTWEKPFTSTQDILVALTKYTPPPPISTFSGVNTIASFFYHSDKAVRQMANALVQMISNHPVCPSHFFLSSLPFPFCFISFLSLSLSLSLSLFSLDGSCIMTSTSSYPSQYDLNRISSLRIPPYSCYSSYYLVYIEASLFF